MSQTGPVTSSKAAEIARLIPTKSNGIPQAVGIDPLTLLTIAGIIVNIIKIFMHCGFSEEDALYRAKNPGIVGRHRIRSVVKKHAEKMPKVYQGEKPIDFRKDIEVALNTSFQTMTLEEVRAIMAENDERN